MKEREGEDSYEKRENKSDGLPVPAFESPYILVAKTEEKVDKEIRVSIDTWNLEEPSSGTYYFGCGHHNNTSKFRERSPTKQCVWSVVLWISSGQPRGKGRGSPS